MGDRLLRLVSGLVRFALVVVAFGLAAGSIGLSAARGFCPEGTELGALRAATLATIVPEGTEFGALRVATLATIVPEDQAGTPDSGTPAPDSGTPTPDSGTPTPEDGATEAPAARGACAGGVQRCLPPLVSSVVVLGDGTCHEEAGSRLRGILVPAFVGSTVLLAGAWWLRPERVAALRDTVRDAVTAD